MTALLLAVLLAAPPPHGGSTSCAVCHTTAGWDQVKFDHQRTGFALNGAHAALGCKECHAEGLTPQPTACVACHADVHAGDRGTRCASCHDEQAWRSRFDADAHRRTNFPLTGRHASIPCTECHTDVRDRSFTLPARQCVGCHQGDFARTAGGAIDHAAAGFSTNCRDCHSVSRWQGARYLHHEACFQLSVGPHAGLSCLACHTSLRGAVADGSCNTGTASCRRCHECGAMERRHVQVSGFQCKDRKCYECHQFSFRSPRLPPARGR